MLSFPDTYTTLKSHGASILCNRARRAAGTQGVLTCSLFQLCRLWWSVHSTMGCKAICPDHLRKAQIMAYVSFSLEIQVRAALAPILYWKRLLENGNHPLGPAPGLLPWHKPMHRC